MKALILNFILGRGVNKALELTSKVARNGMITFGTWLQANDVATAGQVEHMTWGVVAAIGVAWSLIRMYSKPLLRKALD